MQSTANVAGACSGDYVGDQTGFECRQLIAQPQLALLEARKPQLVRHARAGERRDCLVQVAVFKPQGIKALDKVTFGHWPRLAVRTAPLNAQFG